MIIHFNSNRSIFWQEIVLLGQSPESVWKAVTDPVIVSRYHIAILQRIELHENGAIVYGEGDGVIMHGIIKRVRENELLVHSVHFGEMSTRVQPSGMDVAYEINQEGNSVLLRVVHSGLQGDLDENLHLVELWSHILRKLQWLLDRRMVL